MREELAKSIKNIQEECKSHMVVGIQCCQGCAFNRTDGKLDCMFYSMLPPTDWEVKNED